MNKYPVVKIQFETIVYLENRVYITEALTRVHYLLAANMIQSERYNLGKLRVVLDLGKGDQPYLTDDDVLHVHPSHMKEAQTSVIRYF